MPHRVKNKHRARHRAHTVKPPNLFKPTMPLTTETASAAPAAATDSVQTNTVTEDDSKQKS
jgi:hypothetical protein